MWDIAKKRVKDEAKDIGLNIWVLVVSLAEMGNMGERLLMRVVDLRRASQLSAMMPSRHLDV